MKMKTKAVLSVTSNATLSKAFLHSCPHLPYHTSTRVDSSLVCHHLTPRLPRGEPVRTPARGPYSTSKSPGLISDLARSEGELSDLVSLSRREFNNDVSKLKNKRHSSLEYSNRFEIGKGSIRPVSRSSYVYRKVKSLVLVAASISTGSKVRVLSNILSNAVSPLRALEVPGPASIHQDSYHTNLAESCKIEFAQDSNASVANEFPSWGLDKRSGTHRHLAEVTAPKFSHPGADLAIKVLLHQSTTGHNAINNSIEVRSSFNRHMTQLLNAGTSESNFKKNNGYWLGLTMVRFIEHAIKHKVLYQHTNFLASNIPSNYRLLYKKWSDRMRSYERSLGHRFFFEESLHLMHLGLTLHDPKIFLKWLSSMVSRISFWKTRSIFRFMKHLFNNYFINYFGDLRVKGLKVKLKGKISVAGTGRKRNIVYKSGETSFSRCELKAVQEASTIVTFTGVLGVSVTIFY